MFGSRRILSVGIGILIAALLAGCGMFGGAETSGGDLVRDKADVEEVNLLIMESFPIQVAAVARGNLRDGCTEIDEVQSSYDEETMTFTVEITTVREPNAVCTQVLVPFEERIELDARGLAAGTYTVNVNGVEENFTLDVDNELPDTSTSEIPWPEARELILSGEVRQIAQLHSLEVTLELTDGSRLATEEPEIDAFFDVVDRCGEPCADITLVTE